MNLFTRSGRVIFAIALVFFSLGCASGQSKTENLLTTAGFHNVLANPPQQKPGEAHGAGDNSFSGPPLAS